MAGEARQGRARYGKVWQAGLGGAGPGEAGQGRQGNKQEAFMVYQWKDGTRLKADAEKVGKEIEQIKGAKTPNAVVKKARSEKTELHKCFEWDDSAAATQYRLDQARYVLRTISIVREVEIPGYDTPRKVIVRAYENVNTAKPNEDEERAYVETESALAQPEFRLQIFSRLERMIAEATEIADAYRYLSPEISALGDRLHSIKKEMKMGAKSA
jgi:hypothetical protein